MMEESQVELIVEILDQAQDWGRSEYIRLARSQGREVRVLSLVEAHPPADDLNGIWLDLKKHAGVASQMIRDSYPRFLHQAAQKTGLLDIAVLDEKVSLYWFMPISEMSTMRNPLIDKIYALFVFKLVLKDASYKKLVLVLDDLLLEQPLRQIASCMGVQDVEKIDITTRKSLPYYRIHSALVINWWLCFIRDLAYWLILHEFKIGYIPKNGTSVSNTIGLTIFPTLWEKDEDKAMQNRAFGDWTQEQQKHGHTMFYIALPTMKPRKIPSSFKYWRKIASQNNIVFVHSLIQFRDLLSVYFRIGWGKKISKWFQNMKHIPGLIDDIDVTELLRREYLQEIWQPTVPQSMLLARASTSLAGQIKNVSCAVHAFEFQPIEKAFIAGIKFTGLQTTLVGLQTSLIGASHLGYHFLPEQISKTNEIKPPFAPMPDYLATYGNISHALLEKRLGTKRVILTGPIRYPYLKVDSLEDRRKSESDWKQRLNLNGESVLALLALPSLKEEALTILKWTIKTARQFPGLYLLIRFHYWVTLSAELRELSRRYSFDRYQIAPGDLHDILLASHFMITGTSSIGVEAMVSGCMPIAYKTTRRYDIGRMQDVAGGAFFYTNEPELSDAIQSCLSREESYTRRKAQWPFMLQRMCHPLDGKASSRFYNWLDARDVFNVKRANGINL